MPYRRSPSYSRLQQENVDGTVVGAMTSTDVCVAHTVEKALHSAGVLLQAYNTDQATTAIRLHSQSWPLPATSQWGKGAVLQLSTFGAIKNLWFYSRGGTNVVIDTSITQMIPRAQPYTLPTTVIGCCNNNSPLASENISSTLGKQLHRVLNVLSVSHCFHPIQAATMLS